MSTTTPVKVERMGLGRWVRLVGWRHVIALIAVCFAVFPILYIIALAFSGGETLVSACPIEKQGFEALTCLIPTNPDLDNFTGNGTVDNPGVINDPAGAFPIWFRNTVVVASVVASMSLFIGASAAFAFSRLRFKGRRPGLLALVLIQMFPQVLALTAIFLLLVDLGDVFPSLGLQTLGGLMIVYLGGSLGVSTYLMKGFFDTVPIEIDESARIDGASHVRIFFGMILRLSLPVLTVVFFTSFTGLFNELAIAQLVMSDLRDTTLAVGLNSYVSNPLRQNWGYFAAGSLMAAVPLVVVFLATQKNLAGGLTAGAVKG
jgi:arabinogalactan oligomer/maltooligosaccharide transport system permease protein